MMNTIANEVKINLTSRSSRAFILVVCISVLLVLTATGVMGITCNLISYALVREIQFRYPGMMESSMMLLGAFFLLREILEQIVIRNSLDIRQVIFSGSGVTMKVSRDKELFYTWNDVDAVIPIIAEIKFADNTRIKLRPPFSARSIKSCEIDQLICRLGDHPDILAAFQYWRNKGLHKGFIYMLKLCAATLMALIVCFLILDKRGEYLWLFWIKFAIFCNLCVLLILGARDSYLRYGARRRWGSGS